MNDYKVIKEIYGIPEIKYKLDVAPHSAPRMVRSDKWSKRPIVESYFAHRDELRLKCNLVGYKLQDVLNIIFVVGMPKSWSKKRRADHIYQLHKQRPDRDNFLKAFQDSFEGDDGFVADGRTIKIWGLKPEILIF